MHILKDENGNPVPHGGHEHPHEHEHCHEHEHAHDHGQGHDHGHEHDHEHDHGHEHHHHSHAGTGDKALALLSYMYDHNVHHAEELSGLVKQLEEEGRKEAAERIKETVAYYEQGNAIFHEALHMLEGIS